MLNAQVGGHLSLVITVLLLVEANRTILKHIKDELHITPCTSCFKGVLNTHRGGSARAVLHFLHFNAASFA